MMVGEHVLLDVSFECLIAVACGLLAVYIILRHYSSQQRADRELDSLPGPRRLWILGNLPSILSKGQHAAFRDWSIQYGTLFKYYQGSQPIVVASDPVLIRQFASRCSSRHTIPYLETGEEEKFNKLFVLFSKGAWWRSLKSAWQPFFHSTSLQGFAPLMTGAASAMASLITSAINKRKKTAAVVDVRKMYGDLTMAVVGQTAFGVDFKTQNTAAAAKKTSTTKRKKKNKEEYEEEAEELVEAAQAFFETAGPAIMDNPYALLLLMFPSAAPFIRRLANLLPTPSYKKALSSRIVMRRITQKLLDDTRKHVRAEDGTKLSNDTIENSSVGGRGALPGSFLHLMAKAINKETKQPFTDTEATNQAYGFLLAAYETTASALTCATFLVATHPDIETKLHQELANYSTTTLSQQDVEDDRVLPYTKAIFKETLRLYPPVPLMARETENDVILQGRLLPAGTWIQASVQCLHRDPRYWTNPDAFLPERFIASSDKPDELTAYLPWGDGPRGCLGVMFATQEFLLAFTHLHQRFVFRPVENKVYHKDGQLKMKAGLTLAPAHPVLMTVTTRAQHVLADY